MGRRVAVKNQARALLRSLGVQARAGKALWSGKGVAWLKAVDLPGPMREPLAPPAFFGDTPTVTPPRPVPPVLPRVLPSLAEQLPEAFARGMRSRANA